MSVDKLQEAEEHVAQMREEEARAEREARNADLRQPPIADTARSIGVVRKPRTVSALAP